MASELDGITTQTWGSGPPDIVMLHDGLGSITQWGDVPARIAADTGATVMAYDRPGHGRSEPVPDGPWPTEWLRQFYDAYSFNVIPRLGQVLVNDKDSYQYLVESIRRFPRQEPFADMVKTAGFAQVKWQDYSGGIACLHTGWKI